MMARRTIKNLGRRGLALFLSLVMMTSLMQVSAFAADTSGKVMEGSFVLNNKGEVTSTVTEAGHGTVTYADDGFTLTKTAVKTGENQFKVTLKVVTTQTVSKTYDSSATVLVLDMSNSMDYNFGEDTTRLNEAEKVAKEFLASYAGTDADAEQYLSIVWFGTGSGVDQGWVNVAGGAGKNSYDTVYNYLDALDEAPHSGDTGGTNLEAGLKAVQDQLALRKDITEYKNVVVITDGKPTYRINANGNGVSGNGSSGSKANNDAAAARADDIQETATIYTVCIAAESDICYSDSTQYVCKNCQKSRDEHLEVHLCDNCGEAFDEHTRQQGKKGGSYYSCPGANAPYEKNERYSDETYYYCDETLEQQYEGTSVTVNGVTVGDFLKNDIASSTGNAYNAGSADELEEALAAIAAKIEESGSSGKDTSVTDPMGQFIVLGDVSELSNDGVTASGSTITWALDPEKADKVPSEDGKTTTYTYTITYPITLDTADPDFEEVYTTDETAEDYNAELAGKTKYYPTNGYTYLSIPQEGGEPRKLAFRVPGVSGKVPVVDWSVEYYLQGEATKGDYENYIKVEKDTYDGTAVKLWTKVYTPEGYTDKYDDQDYQHVAGTSELTLSSTNAADNVMRHYYDRIQANATVRHWYKTNTWTRAGEYVAGEYTTEAMTSGTVEGLYVGESYTADRVYKYGDFSYTADESVNENNCPEGGNQRINTDTISSVSRDSEKNVINFYYTRTVDERQPTSAKVLHTYVTYGYVLEDGKYVLKETGRNTVTVQDETELIATTSFDVISAPQTGYESYELTENGDYKTLTNDGNGNLSFVLVEDASQNTRELVFEDTVDEREPVTVTVRHYYTKVVTEVVDGEVVGPTKVIDNDLGKEEVFEKIYYAGETFTATEATSYNNDIYESDPSNAAALAPRQLTGDAVIELKYNLIVEPETTKVIVNHHYRTHTTTITETIDPETGEVTGYTKRQNTSTVDDNGYESSVLYVGESYEATIKGRDGFAFNQDDSDPLAVKAEKIPVVIDLYYDKYETDDQREAATISVQHNYYVDMGTIVDGKVGIRRQSEGTETENFPAEGDTLKAGEPFTAVPNTKNDLYTVESSDPLSVVLQSGDNTTIVINYIRQDSNLVDATYTVDYVYNTYNMYVDTDGVAKYPTTPSNTENGEQASGSGYVGQSITLDPKTREGFTAAEGNPAVNQTLNEKNAWTFVYEQYIPLGKGTVQVNHHYTTNTIAINGTTSSSTSTTTGTPVAKYVGETYVANADDKGFTLVDSKVTTQGAAAAAENVQSSYTLTVIDGAIVVDFYYEKTVDNSKVAEYKVYHEYYLYDYDRTLRNENKPAPETGTGYVTNPVKAMPDANDGYTLISATYNGAPLEADYTFQLIEGENVVVFVYEKTLPQDKVDVKVIHNYYKDEASMTGETAEVESRYEQTFTEVPEDSVFTATEYYMENAAYTYSFHSSNPAPNAETGAVSITVTDDGENVIIMNYIRATAQYKVIHIYNRNGVEEGRTETTLGGLDGEVILADSIERVPEYDGKTYTFKSISGDLVLNADEQQIIILDSDEMQTVTLVYNRTVSSGGGGGGGNGGGGNVPPVIIEEEEPPLANLPDEEPPLAELPEEEVPLAAVPMTGDTTALYALLAMGSAMGLMYLFLTGKKREEEI